MELKGTTPAPANFAYADGSAGAYSRSGEEVGSDWR